MTASTTRRGFGIVATGVREERRRFSLAVFGSVVYGAMTVADAWVLGWATDHVVTPSFRDGELATGAAVVASLLFVTVAILRAWGVIVRRLVGGAVFYRLLASYRRRVTRRYLALPMRWHAAHPTGRLLSNANADVEATWAVMMPLPMAVGVAAMLVAAVGAMLMADVVLTLVGLVVFPLLFAVNVGYQRLLSPRVTRAQELRATVSAIAHESFDGAQVVKTLGRESEETARFATSAEDLRDANIAAGRIRSVFDPVIEALPNIAVLLVVVIGVERVLAGDIEAGAVVQVAYLFTVVGFPLRAFGWVLGELPRTVVGWDRVDSVLQARGDMPYGDRDLPAPSDHDSSTSGVNGDADSRRNSTNRGRGARLEVDGLRFGYDPARPVLDDLTFTVEPGSVTAVVGLTGAGKSTLASLVDRLVDPDAGAVRLDGTDVRDLSHEALARAVALVPQHTFVFDDTVRDNVALGAGADDERVWSALEVAQAAEFVSTLPEGLDTRLGERGTSLSGGQRQRVALARALVREPRLLVLDDATSALDADVEQRILRSLAATTAAGAGPTVFVVAYRKATIALADEVLFLADGRIVDRGPHTDLVARSPEYAEIVQAYDTEAAT
ncbi:ABC-type multidrug transport system fused ATPase/permease subunit [Mumia flava]|uniref:ABC-type multidrug transport system fused ATPase/permease subunit n=1 Tax=Mumia flava TaxID=1348852 RepID=A0A0B2BQB7_9ACTN|nr:ABC transporter ATP-binding protein [Mumia flava]PJJ55997.1 ABC-type multidrug transport system fused ATPase/permease subunit [Mumia flava]